MGAGVVGIGDGAGVIVGAGVGDDVGAEVGKEVGLVDSVGEMRTEMQKRFGRHVRLEKVEDETAKMELSRLLRWLL